MEKVIFEINHGETIEIEKYNPYHGPDGRFTSGNGATLFTIPKDPKLAAKLKEKEKKRVSGGGSGNTGETEKATQTSTRQLKLDTNAQHNANNNSQFDAGDALAREAHEVASRWDEEFKVDPNWTDEQKAYAAKRRDEYIGLVEDVYNDQMRRRASWVPVNVAGPARYNSKRNNSRVDAQIKAGIEGGEKIERFKENTRKGLENLKPLDQQLAEIKNHGLKWGEKFDYMDKNAEAKLKANLEYHEKQHQTNLAANKYWNKNHTLVGFNGMSEEKAKKANEQIERIYGDTKNVRSPFSTTSSNRSVKAAKEKLQTYERMQAAASKGNSSKSVGGANIVRNTSNNRLQIKFDSIPSPEMRAQLKSRGFRWSPREQAWQRVLTDNAEAAANSILNNKEGK